MKKYAYYGIQKLKKLYFKDNEFEDKFDYLTYIRDNIKVKSEINYQEHFSEVKNKDVFEILKEME